MKKQSDKIADYIKRYSSNPDILTEKEIRRIKNYELEDNLNYVEFNKKGHLVFRQRYPYFPLYFSIFALLVNVIIFILILLKLYL